MIFAYPVFISAHANYPSQPSYARLVELIIPSLMFGGVYLKYGLLPSIISHFVFDVVWFALPIFVSAAPDAFPNQVLVVFFSAVPLFIALYVWLRRKKTPEGAVKVTSHTHIHTHTHTKFYRRVIIVLGSLTLQDQLRMHLQGDRRGCCLLEV